MGIRYHGRLTIDIAADEVGGFSTNAREGYKLLNSIGNNSTEALHYPLTYSDKVARLGFIKATGFDKLLNLRKLGILKCFCIRETCEKRRGYHVYSGIGALG